MDSRFFLNKRVFAIIVFIISILTFICYILYAWETPKLNQIATETRVVLTQDAGAITQISQNATLSSASTQTAKAIPTATITPTHTLTSIPTFTPSITPTQTTTPNIIPCSITLNPGTFLYKHPSEGVSGEKYQKSEEVYLIAQAKTLNWSKVSINNQFYWVRNDEILSSCPSNQISLSFLTEWDQLGEVVLEENFSTSHTWKNEYNEVIIPNPVSNQSDSGVYVLNLDAEKFKKAYISDQTYGNLPHFSLFTSYQWKRGNGEVGIRFWDDGVNYYEIRVNNECMLELYDSGVNINERKAKTTDCYFDYFNFLTMSVKEEGTKSVAVLSLNDTPEITFSLPQTYHGENFSWRLYGASSIDLSYLIIIRQ